jgi:hypothetical protein
MLLNDTEIARLAEAGMITPFVPDLVRQVAETRTWAEGPQTITRPRGG